MCVLQVRLLDFQRANLFWEILKSKTMAGLCYEFCAEFVPGWYSRYNIFMKEMLVRAFEPALSSLRDEAIL
jgi:hypothetical protein